MSQGHLCQMLLLNRNPGRKKKSPVGVGSKVKEVRRPVSRVFFSPLYFANPPQRWRRVKTKTADAEAKARQN